MRPPAEVAATPDAGSSAITFLIKVAVVLGLLGVVGYDAIMIGTTAMSLNDQAYAAASAGADAYQTSRDMDVARAAAERSAQTSNPANVLDTTRFTVSPNGTVRVVLDRTAVTILAHRLPTVRNWTDVSADESASPSP